MSNHRTIPCPCPYCHNPLSAVGQLDNGAKPFPGDFSVCITCAGVLVFCDDLTVRKPTQEERDIAEKSVAVFNTQYSIRRLHALKSGKCVLMGGTA